MQYDFNLQPNESTTLAIAGRFFKYKSGTGLIRIRATGGGYVDLLPGQGVWNVDFSELTVTDRSGLANAGVLVAGAFDFRDDRIAGSVEVIDGGKNRTAAGGAFTTHLSGAANPGFFSGCQLWNPPGSGKNIIVEQILPVIQSPYGLQVVITNAIISGGTAGVTGNKKSGGGLPVGVGYYTSTAAAALVSNAIFGLTLPIKMSEPFIITPGYGLVFGAPVANAYAGADIEFFEESL